MNSHEYTNGSGSQMVRPALVWLLTALALFVLPIAACRSKFHRQAKSHRVHTAVAVPAVSNGTAHRLSEDARCPQFASGLTRGRVETRALTEASGLVASRKNPGVLWSHNDSGANPTLYAFAEDGRALGTYHLKGVVPIDWEDIATGPAPSPEEYYLYVGDIGDNVTTRSRVTVYRVLEPHIDVAEASGKHKLDDVLRYDFAYDDGTSQDAESLMIDPRSGDLYVVTKPRDTLPKVYRAKAPLDSRNVGRLTEVATLSVFSEGSRRSTLVTAADISPDGRFVLIRSYTSAYLFRRDSDKSIAEALKTPPCRVPLSLEPQGEAIAFSPSGNAYFTVSEGHRPSIFEFSLIAHPGASLSTAAPTSSQVAP